jgi:hypothetical protein
VANNRGTIFCEITTPGNQYSPGVYAFRDHANYTISEFFSLSKYVWAEDSVRGVRWVKNPDRDISHGLARLTTEEEKQFVFVKLRANFI